MREFFSSGKKKNCYHREDEWRGRGVGGLVWLTDTKYKVKQSRTGTLRLGTPFQKQTVLTLIRLTGVDLLLRIHFTIL